MRNEARGDVWKVWLYAAASVTLGAWISPLLYNAGKALAEVSSAKSTNGLLDWLAGICRAADFTRFHGAAILLAAALLFLPWMEWIHAPRGTAVARGPWRLRLPYGARMALRGQPLREQPNGFWHLCAGFLVAAGLLLPMAVAMVPAGFFSLRSPVGGLAPLAVKTLSGGFLLAAVMEVFFRGVAMGIFLRAMRPSAALGMSAAFFALVLSVIPQAGVGVADPDAAGTGFELLGRLFEQLADWRALGAKLLPLLALGLVLAYARWRTESLWMPIGLHTGWLFSKGMLGALGVAVPQGAGALLLHGLAPTLALLIAGILAHYLTAHHADEAAVRF
jgi:membrane protease YdiL (CAAX protease family)